MRDFSDRIVVAVPGPALIPILVSEVITEFRRRPRGAYQCLEKKEYPEEISFARAAARRRRLE
jgi:hypothetical protein